MGESGSRSTEFKLQVKNAGSKEEEPKKSVDISRNRIKIVKKILKDIRKDYHFYPRPGPLQYEEYIIK